MSRTTRSRDSEVLRPKKAYKRSKKNVSGTLSDFELNYIEANRSHTIKL